MGKRFPCFCTCNFCMGGTFIRAGNSKSKVAKCLTNQLLNPTAWYCELGRLYRYIKQDHDDICWFSYMCAASRQHFRSASAFRSCRSGKLLLFSFFLSFQTIYGRIIITVLSHVLMSPIRDRYLLNLEEKKWMLKMRSTFY